MKILSSFLLFFIFFYGNSQNNDDNLPVKEISKDACQCISQIKINNTTKNDAIKNCINIAISKTNLQKATTNKQLYSEIENYLTENCEALKTLSFSENENFKHATSNNVLAQLAYDDGMDYLNNKDFDNAILKFKKAVKIDSNFAFAWDNLGVSLRKINKYEEAIDAYKKSLEINANGRLPLINIAVTYNLNKDIDNAIKYYNKFINLYPEDAEGYYGLGLILYTHNKQAEGLDHLIHAYTIYTATNSPYKSDAAKKIGYMYNNLKKQNKLNIFNEVAKKYNLKIN